MSAQGLADKCGELGYPVPRSVIANLENDRRETITVPELLVIAAALGVPPLLLMFPVGEVAEMEVLPDIRVAPMQGFDWASGSAPLNEQSRETFNAAARIVWMFGNHQFAVEELLKLRRETRRVVADSGDFTFDPRLLASHENSLRENRARMREEHLSLPELPSELAYIADQEAAELANEQFSPALPRKRRVEPS